MAACGTCRGQQNCFCNFEVTCVEEVMVGEFLSMPGPTGHFVSTPDSALTSLSGDLDIRAKVALADWTPADDVAIVAKWNTVGNQRSYLFRVTPAGELELVTSPDGTAEVTVTSTVPLGFGDGSVQWIRVSLDAEDQINQGVYSFFTSLNGVDWSLLGATQFLASVTIFDSTVGLEIGSIDGGTDEILTEQVWYAEVRNGPNTNVNQPAANDGFYGEIVAVFNPKRAIVTGAQVPATVDSPVGETWTIVGDDWAWQDQLAPQCTTLTGNGSSYAPINFRPNNVPLPRPYGHVTRTDPLASQTVATSTTASIIFNHDATSINGKTLGGSMADLAVFNTRLTAPIDGYYLIGTNILFEDNDLLMSIVRHSPTVPFNMFVAMQDTYDNTTGSYTFSGLIDLAAGDWVEIQVTTDSSGSADIVPIIPGISIYYNYQQFWAQWMRPLDF